MSLKDIEKLKEKVDKDLNSKLFVPLAEEYKKEGMLDEAINVLLSGLENQPGYTSARVSLGKIYLDKGMRPEATDEFEKVIKQIPDNLFAHKKLAEIYKDTGKKEQAIKSFKAVLKLNPMDEDAVTKLKEIEGEASPEETTEKIGAATESMHESTSYAEEEVIEDTHEVSEPQALSGEISETPPDHDEELTAFRSSLFGNTGEAEIQAEAIAEVIITEKEEENLEVLDEPFQIPEEEISFGDINDAKEEENLEVIEEPIQIPEEDISFGDINEALEYVETDLEDISEEAKAEEIIEETEEVSFTEKEPDFTEPYAKKSTIEDADKHISKGSYMEAMTVYRNILSSAPDDKKVLQRVEELRGLIKLMGKDKELLISKLNIFLEGVNKRRDEFLRST